MTDDWPDPYAWLHDNDFSWDDVNAIAAVLEHGGFGIIHAPTTDWSQAVENAWEDLLRAIMAAGVSYNAAHFFFRKHREQIEATTAAAHDTLDAGVLQRAIDYVTSVEGEWAAIDAGSVADEYRRLRARLAAGWRERVRVELTTRRIERRVTGFEVR